MATPDDEKENQPPYNVNYALRLSLETRGCRATSQSPADGQETMTMLALRNVWLGIVHLTIKLSGAEQRDAL